jgi:integrase
MLSDEGTLQALLGGLKLKTRVQHPKIHECKDWAKPYWFFRYWQDEVPSDGLMKSTRKRQIVGPSKGDGALTRKQAEVERDKFLVKINAPTERAAAAKGVVLIKDIAKMYMESHLGRRNKISIPTRCTETSMINRHIIPAWGELRLNELESKAVEDWLYDTFDSWWTMRGVKKVMGALYTKAEQWGFWEESKKSPISRVQIGSKEYKWDRRILNEEEIVHVLARIEQPYLLICETCIATGTRISEVLGLQIKHVDLKAGTIKIEQRNWHGDISKPKTKGSQRTLTLGDLTDDYCDWLAKRGPTNPQAWVFPQDTKPGNPMWDCGVRKALKQAAADEGLDFPGFGLHSLRRANITWRQKMGGASSIETSRIAGHSSVEITEEYTFVDLERQRETTQAIRDRLQEVRETTPEQRVDLDEALRDRLLKARQAKAEKRAADRKKAAA